MFSGNIPRYSLNKSKTYLWLPDRGQFTIISGTGKVEKIVALGEVISDYSLSGWWLYFPLYFLFLCYSWYVASLCSMTFAGYYTKHVIVYWRGTIHTCLTCGLWFLGLQ